MTASPTPVAGRIPRALARRSRRLAAWLFAVALFGYPLVGALVSFLQIDSRTLSIPFRLLVAGAGFVLLARSSWPRAGGARTLLMLVWATYTLRLLYDTFVVGVESADYALMFFVAGSLVPALALLASSSWNQLRFARISLALSISACAAILLGTLRGQFGDSDLTEATGRLTVVALNPITLGNLGVSAILCAVVLWRSVTPNRRMLLTLAIGLALVTVVATGSKGPALALVVCLVAWSLRRMSTRWWLVGLALPLGVLVLASGDSALTERISASAEDLSTLDRVVLIQNSLTQIAEAPIFGSSFVERESGYYPHNLLLEAALALGIPMAGLFVVLLVLGARRAWQTLGSLDEDLLGMLYLQAIVEGAVSGAMFGATMLWITLALLFRAQPRLRARAAAARSIPPGDGALVGGDGLVPRSSP